MARSIPILPLSKRRAHVSGFGAELRTAWRDFGFVGIVEHGITEDVVRAALAGARAFFALPDAIKRRYEVVGGAGQRGYTRLCVEKARDQALPDLKEFWHVGREVGRDDPLAAILLPNLWPDEVAGFRKSQLALFAALERLGGELLEALAPTLGLPAGWFAARIARGNSILRAIHYPPLPRTAAHVAAPTQVRAAAHEDINLITLLVGSDEPGLELQTRAGEWLPITTLPGTVVVNVGDMLQRLTNGVLPSTTHRVVNPSPPWDTRSRHSIPFFLHFEPEVLIETLPSCISADRPNQWPTPIRAHDYLEQRLREIGLLA
ncbi:MAG: isopenicillin N synthase family oxygenase [Myxococcales bacterium]|nr:isopenicillin N synthase family oxygenase [Myxococcales bacterium]